MIRLAQRDVPTRTLVGTFLLLFFAFTYVHQEHYRTAATPVSRLDLLHALLVHRSVSIDPYAANTTDRATYEGHYFSDKAPGIVVVALPAFATAAIMLRAAGVPLDSDSGWFYSSWVASAGSNALIAASGACALLAWLSRYVAARWALVTTLTLFLGAAPLPYATMMHSHATTVGLIAVAIWAIERQSEQHAGAAALPTSATHGLDVLAGFACGLALASEYTAGLVIAGILAWLLSLRWQRAIPFCVAALPPLLLIPAYSWVCFGDPFLLPYSLSEMFPPMREGLYAIKWPDPATAYNLMFSPSRGLLFWTPFLIITGVGYWQLSQSNIRLLLLTAAIPLLQLIVISGRTFDWQAGPTLGPRYLAPILPLLALPAALGLQRFPRVGIVLAIFSVVLTTVATLTDACPISNTYNPLIELHVPLFLDGQFSPNLGMLLGLSPYASIALYYVALLAGCAWLWRSLPNRNAAPRQDVLLRDPGSQTI